MMDLTYYCPECGYVSTVGRFIRRPICLHVLSIEGTPEIWDADDSGGHGRRIEDSPQAEYRSPGPRWQFMVALPDNVLRLKVKADMWDRYVETLTQQAMVMPPDLTRISLDPPDADV